MKSFMLTTAALTALAVAMPAAATDLRMLASWDRSNTAVPLIADPFMEKVKEKSGGDISFTLTGPEAVPPFDQLQPTSSGVFDLLFTHPGYHAGEVGPTVALDVIDGDPDKRRESGVWDWVDQFYQDNFNLKVISIPTALTGYRIYMAEPLVDGRLDGLKVRGTGAYQGMIEALGGSQVVLPAGEMYAALERGIVDGAAWPAVGAVGFKFCEVAPNIVEPSFGSVSEIILMNLDSWNRLDESEQAILLEAGVELEHNTVSAFEEVLAAEDETSMACGSVKDVQADGWHDMALGGFATKVWEIASTKSPEAAQALRQLALDNGMTK